MVGNASVKLHTSCGIEVVTVSPEFFDDDEVWDQYMYALNEVYCGDGSVPARP